MSGQRAQTITHGDDLTVDLEPGPQGLTLTMHSDGHDVSIRWPMNRDEGLVLARALAAAGIILHCERCKC